MKRLVRKINPMEGLPLWFSLLGQGGGGDDNKEAGDEDKSYRRTSSLVLSDRSRVALTWFAIGVMTLILFTCTMPPSKEVIFVYSSFPGGVYSSFRGGIYRILCNISYTYCMFLFPHAIM